MVAHVDGQRVIEGKMRVMKEWGMWAWDEEGEVGVERELAELEKPEGQEEGEGWVEGEWPTDERLLHPAVGELSVHCQTLVAENHAQSLLVYTATPGTENARKLELVGIVGREPVAA